MESRNSISMLCDAISSRDNQWMTVFVPKSFSFNINNDLSFYCGTYLKQIQYRKRSAYLIYM